MPGAYGSDFRAAVVRACGEESVQTVACLFGISRPTVYKYLKISPNYANKYGNCGSVTVSDDEKLKILLASIENPFRSARQIRRLLGLDLSDQAITAILRKAGLKSRHAATKIKLKPVNRRKRIEWSTFYMDQINWDKCIFVDESCFSTGRDGIKSVRRPKQTRYDPNYVNESDHCSRKLVSVFGMVCKKQFGPLVRLNSRLDRWVYAEIFDTVVVEFIKQHYGSSQCYIIADNCPAHNADLIKAWFDSCNSLHDINLTRIQLPPYSADLNIIENAWGKVKRDLLYDVSEPTDSDELWTRINYHWNALNSTNDSSYASALINSMNKRCDLVIRSDGYQIKY